MSSLAAATVAVATEELVYIGVPAQEQKSASTWASSPYVSKVGGPPASFDDTPVNAGDCNDCGTALCLVAQIYAPLDFARSVLIFGCNNADCKHKSSGAWRVLRLQNCLDTDPWGENNGKSAVVESDTTVATVSNDDFEDDLEALLAIRDATVSNRKAEESKPSSGPLKKRSEKMSASSNISSSHDQWKPLLLEVMDEPAKCEDSATRRIEKKYKHLVVDPLHGYTFGEKVGDSGEGGKKGGSIAPDTLKTNDEMVDFHMRLLRAPRQCVRYGYGTAPLWPDRPNPDFTVPKCEWCGEQRQFELQLTPALLSLGNDADTMDWSTILVYSCQKSCDGGGGNVEEFLHVIP